MLSPQFAQGTFTLMNAASSGHLIVLRQKSGEVWKDKTIKSFSSFSHLHVGCSSDSV